MTNPFTSRNLVKDANCFFGRKREIEEIFTNLVNLQSTSILGERRTGKSSLLWHISQPEIYNAFPVGDSRPLLIVFFDLQKVANFTTETFFRLLGEDLNECLPEEYKTTFGSSTEYQILFSELVDRACDNFRIVVCLDEFETVVHNKHFDGSFLVNLRSFANLGKLAYVTSSRETLQMICTDTHHLQGSEFWNIFVIPGLHLNLLRRDEAIDLVNTLSSRGGIEFNADEIEFLFELSGYHPMFLQIASFHLFEMKHRLSEAEGSDEITPLIKSQLTEEYLDGVLPHFEHIWGRLNSTEQEVVSTCGNISADGEYKDIIRTLKQRGILVDDQGLRPFSKCFEAFVKGRAPQSRKAGEPITITPSPETPVNADNERTPVAGNGYIGGQPVEADELTKGKLDIWLGRSSEVLVSFSGPYNIAKFCANHAKLDVNSIKRFDSRVRSLPHTENWRLEKQEIGQDVTDLFASVPEVTEIYNGARAAMDDEEQLLITFKCSQEMLAFPFEFINTFSTADEGIKHLALTHPLSKSVVGIRSKKRPLSRTFYADPKIKILLVNSNVSGEVRIQNRSFYLPEIPGTLLEIRTLQMAMSNFKEAGAIQCSVDVREDVTCEEMSRLIRNGGYDLIHFSGHGMYSDTPENSCLFFWKKPGGASADNSIEVITANQLNDLVSKTVTKFIYLSCCHGGALAESQKLLVNDFLGITHALLIGGIPAVLSMRWALNDEMAVHLATAFYNELLMGAGLEVALLRARRQVQAAKPYDFNWLSPILVVQG